MYDNSFQKKYHRSDLDENGHIIHSEMVKLLSQLKQVNFFAYPFLQRLSIKIK